MAAPAPELRFNTRFEPHVGEPVELAAGVVRITASNPGPFTFTGTNSFLVGSGPLVIVDPGPADRAHRAALIAAIGARAVTAILLTHTHRDHSAGAPALAKAVGAPIWFGGQPGLRRRPRLFETIALGRETDRRLKADRVLADGDELAAGGIRMRVLATPGHAANHLCFDLADIGLLLSGDHVMGWNSTVVAPPDGSMADYLASLRRLVALGPRRYLPAHGGGIADGQNYARALLAHREARNVQVVGAVATGAATLDDLLGIIYPNVSRAVRPAALLTLEAHLEYLAENGQVTITRGTAGPRILPGPRGAPLTSPG